MYDVPRTPPQNSSEVVTVQVVDVIERQLAARAVVLGLEDGNIPTSDLEVMAVLSGGVGLDVDFVQAVDDPGGVAGLGFGLPDELTLGAVE